MVLIHTIQDQAHDRWVQEVIRSDSLSTSGLVSQPFKIEQAPSMKMMRSRWFDQNRRHRSNYMYHNVILLRPDGLCYGEGAGNAWNLLPV